MEGSIKVVTCRSFKYFELLRIKGSDRHLNPLFTFEKYTRDKDIRFIQMANYAARTLPADLDIPPLTFCSTIGTIFVNLVKHGRQSS